MSTNNITVDDIIADSRPDSIYHQESSDENIDRRIKEIKYVRKMNEESPGCSTVDLHPAHVVASTEYSVECRADDGCESSLGKEESTQRGECIHNLRQPKPGKPDSVQRARKRQIPQQLVDVREPLKDMNCTAEKTIESLPNNKVSMAMYRSRSTRPQVNSTPI
uniref:Uncharacterized protein LOC100377466 n=1 Tax=Saccoglossus kowalevskii TaxID=10224 RepID=A0ABM0GN48_SACKO|nr:PREDICTED: uncharacterized protein LOC100377466 [Saccoglossus kowalevskii]